jgi:hypothetical protein
MTSLLTPRLLSASVAAGYTTFGAAGLARPLAAQRAFFGLAPATPAEAALLRTTALAIFARDASVAAALWWLWGWRRHREMGVVIVAGTGLCAVDCALLWMARGWKW